MTTTLDRPPAAVATEQPRSRREVLEALSGLLLAMFVAILSSTIWLPDQVLSPPIRKYAG